MVTETHSLTVAWWNCRLSPPGNGKKYPLTDETLSVIQTLLVVKNADVLGLCEVDSDNIALIEEFLKKSRLEAFEVLSLYEPKASGDHLCVIYNKYKLSQVGEHEKANARDKVFKKWYRAGVFVPFVGFDAEQIFIGFSHWQSRLTYPEEGAFRSKLGDSLRVVLDKIMQFEPESSVIICGDYNDEPYNRSIQYDLGATRDASLARINTEMMFNPFWPLMGSPDGVAVSVGSYIGSNTVTSNVLMYDQIMLSSSTLQKWTLADRQIVNEVPASEWLEVSDHYPVLVSLRSN